MSSIISNFKGSIILYQHGLCDNEDSMRETIDKLVLTNPLKNMKFTRKGMGESNSFIDMSKYSYGGFSNFDEEDKVNDALDELVETARMNPKKNVHLRTRLGGDKGLDSIELQKIRLEYILRYLVNTKKTTSSIVLIGHSQGGLVNLEAAIDYPTFISKIISIATPYNPNDLGKLLMGYVNLCRNIMKIDPVTMALTDSYTDSERSLYEQRVNNLIDSDYFLNLKTRWNNLKSKPFLHVISGTSGKLQYSLGLGMNVVIRCGFDGLVTTYEQSDITYNSYQPLVDLSIECLSRSTSDWWNGTYKTTCKNCQVFGGNCILSTLNVDNLITNSVLSAVGDWFKGKGFNIEKKFVSVMNTIQEALNNQPLSDTKHQNLYNIYSGPYNHDSIRRNSLCIFSIRSVIE